MTRLHWGIAATGGIAKAFTRTLQRTGGVVTAVGSRTEASADAFAEEFALPTAHGSYSDLAKDAEVDIVYVASPHDSHAELAILMIEHGKHVLLEKPLTINRREAEAIRDAADRKGVFVMEAMRTRYHPVMIRAREVWKSGVIGDIRSVSADFTQQLPRDPEHRINNLELGGGGLLDLGIYPVSFICDVLGIPTEVRAIARLGETGADIDTAMLFRFDSEAIAVAHCSTQAKGQNRATIIGSDGRIELGPNWFDETPMRVILNDGTIVEEFPADDTNQGLYHQAEAAEAYIAEGLRTSPILSIDESIDIMGVLDTVREQIGVRYSADN